MKGRCRIILEDSTPDEIRCAVTAVFESVIERLPLSDDLKSEIGTRIASTMLDKFEWG